MSFFYLTMYHFFELVAPRWNSKAPDSLKEIPIYSNGNLSCDVYAQPEPVIKWYRDGTEITQSR